MAIFNGYVRTRGYLKPPSMAIFPATVTKIDRPGPVAREFTTRPSGPGNVMMSGYLIARMADVSAQDSTGLW